jgi:hypothetical protein
MLEIGLTLERRRIFKFKTNHKIKIAKFQQQKFMYIKKALKTITQKFHIHFPN